MCRAGHSIVTEVKKCQIKSEKYGSDSGVGKRKAQAGSITDNHTSKKPDL